MLPVRRERGFTLLEVLVVVLIIGIVLAVAAIGFNRDDDKRLQTEARRFGALLTLASQEAVLQAKEFAVAFDDHGYRFLVLDTDKQWSAPDERTFRARELPEDMYLDVDIDGQAQAFIPDQEDQGKKSGGPRIFLLSSGEVSPFELVIREQGSPAEYRVRGDIGGQLEFGE